MRRRNRGAALILVLGAVAILAVLAVELASRASARSLQAARSVRDAGYRRLFDSGAEVARAHLFERDPLPYHYWGERWNREIAFDLGPGESASVRLADENGKINLARIWSHPDERPVIRRMVSRLFEYLKRHDPSRAGLWKAAEARLRKRLDSPDPLVTLEGLRGGGFGMEDIFGDRGLSRYFTTFGNGRINLNTAPKAVLYAIDEDFGEDQVERIAAYRGRGDGETGPYRPFEEPQDLMLIDGIVIRALVDGEFRIVRNLFERVAPSVTVMSTAFSCRMKARMGNHAREAWTFLKPDTTRLAFEEIFP